MNANTGLGSNGIPFEYTVAEKKTPVLLFKRITLIALYCLWAAAWLVFGVSFQLIVPFLALIPISLWIIVFLTWRFTQVEYEYSFFSGVLTVCRILGGRSRKKLAEITIRDCVLICPCTDANAAQMEAFGEEKTVFAASSASSPELWTAMWSDENGTKCALYFEPTEQAVKILKYYNSSALSRAAKN